ncbi:MAG: 50S ribosomal protein L29 [Porticoccaceae bacterium]|nr:50S ribosomal protein L29 [Porticoccaceae bacterium]
MKVSEVSDKPLKELKLALAEEQKKHFNIKAKMKTGQLSETHLVAISRKNIARLKTIINSKAGD